MRRKTQQLRKVPSIFRDRLQRWALTPDGAPIETRGSSLLPVRRRGVPAMVKIAMEDEERRGGALMAWWGGQSAARVLEHAGNAILLERAESQTLLADFARNGKDDEASQIICAVVAALHAPRAGPLPELVTLSRWFRDLEPAAAALGGILAVSASTAHELLAAPRNPCVLHGDIHHGNVLYFGERGWLAIDPKGLAGEQGFDYANLFCNPDVATALAPGRFARQIRLVADTAELGRRRLLQWVLAWAGLSSAWSLSGGASPHADLAVAELAAAELRR